MVSIFKYSICGTINFENYENLYINTTCIMEIIEEGSGWTLIIACAIILSFL